MKNLSVFVAIFSLVSLLGCQDAEDLPSTDFTINFKATYGGETLEKNKDYIFGSYPIFFEGCRLYLSDIRLVNAEREVIISEIEYLDFTPENAASATPAILFKNVPEGDYTSVSIGYGVKPQLNAKRPSNFPAGSPLSIEIDYWAGWKSYIFSVLDGKADPDNNGTKNLSFSYHCGSDAVYKIFEFNVPIKVKAGQFTTADIAFDMKEFLTNDDGSLYDMVANPATSNDATNVVVAQALTAHWGRATTITQ
ncbi:MAG TPA: hypothetical protein DCF33_13455 [Saprospirales bacterium]|nr:hypothetical protein [Saprospirales bacterium]